MKRIVAILQARMGSTRLPRKVMADVEGKPLLWHLINRVKHSKLISEIILATTTSEEDKEILTFAKKIDLNCYAGSIDDVLDRYYQAAILFNAEIIIRITADCPVIDPPVLDAVIQLFLDSNCDYVSNTLPPTFPDGLDVEVFSFKTLKEAWDDAKLTSEREHVTPYIRNHPEIFQIKNYSQKNDLSQMRWTIDEKEDLLFIREIYKYLFPSKKIFLLDDILELLKTKPELMEINEKFSRNEGYEKSLKEDKLIE